MSNYGFIPRALCPLAKTRLLKNIAVFDIETTEWPDDATILEEQTKQEWHNKRIDPFLVMYADDKKRLFWEGKDCIKDFLTDHLTKQNRYRVVFAHNGGKFDFLALYETLIRDRELSDRFIASPFLAHGRIIALKIKDHKKHVWHFRDSYSLLMASLNRLCESFQPEHKKLLRPSCSYHENPEAWKTYGMNDCLALYDILVLFNDTIRDVGGCVGYTIASTAMLTYRRKFLKQEIPNYFPYNQLFRNAYYGGRVEIINMYAPDKGSPYYYYDVNSEYPAVMYENRFPISHPKLMRYKDAAECFGKSGIMECVVKAPEYLSIPLLPYREPLTGKLLFPLGSWKGFYEFSLIEKAIMLGYDVECIKAYEFDDDYIFRDYVGTFYKLKQETTGATRETMKRLLNSLYGKFGEHPEREELITDPDTDITGSYPYDDVFGYSIKKFVRHSAYHLPVIAARVTALAQLKLYSYIEEAQRLGGIIYYMDTDSLVTNVRMNTSSDLGGIKKEYDIRKAVFLSPKTYCLNLYDDDKEHIVLKGFTHFFHDHICFKDFEEALKTRDLSKFVEETIEPASMKTVHIRHLDGFVTVLSKKSLCSFYDKRTINPDYSTEPLRVPLPLPLSKPEILSVSSPDKSIKRKTFEKTHAITVYEKNMIIRLKRLSTLDTSYLLKCIRLAHTTDFDLEMEIDWKNDVEPLDTIRKKTGQINLDDIDRYL